MKKRHQQKMVILSLALLLMLNVPMVLIFDQSGSVFGIPLIYFFIFLLWILGVVISYAILNRYHE
ncbi:MAG: hypothetical protein WBG90_14200 [Saonia sp.]